jgi:hypothetical protein
MKVYLGKPKNLWFGPYQLADLLMHFGVSEDKCDEIGEKLAYSWVNDLLNWVYEHNPFRKPAEIIHIDHWDTWSMDHTLAPIILKMLKKFKENLHGAPNVDDSDVPDSIKSMNAPRVKELYDTDEFYFKRWDYVIDEMIWSFEHIVNDDWEHMVLVQFNDPESYKFMQDRVDNGLRLFGKYFRNLWS